MYNHSNIINSRKKVSQARNVMLEILNKMTVFDLIYMQALHILLSRIDPTHYKKEVYQNKSKTTPYNTTAHNTQKI